MNHQYVGQKGGWNQTPEEFRLLWSCIVSNNVIVFNLWNLLFLHQDGEGNVCPEARLLLPAESLGNSLLLQYSKYFTQQNWWNHGISLSEGSVLFSAPCSFTCSCLATFVLLLHLGSQLSPEVFQRYLTWISVILEYNEILKMNHVSSKKKNYDRLYFLLWVPFSIIHQIYIFFFFIIKSNIVTVSGAFYFQRQLTVYEAEILALMEPKRILLCYLNLTFTFF